MEGEMTYPEKMRSNFIQTCSRFSHFLKENRTLGHLHAFKGAKDVYGAKNPVTNLELFPMADSRELPLAKEEAKNTSKTPSMTIFYGGKVLVFDELPEDNAREIVALATRGTINAKDDAQTQTQTQTSRSINTTTTQLAQGTSSLSDLPLARRVSLHRFMEKRKHRIASNAPYNLESSMVKVSDLNPQKFNTIKKSYTLQLLELKL
ncbi:protein TIFY 10A-like isoform X2 [Amaranthus tricolor]|uniref:protein TIFY 10A-like isoform X2 n=1 Tax=Amaranthus tricolor TaxID=29722 RepID=UPI00259059E5|nr:protein TIFY 10A-like isoform X2 [Amaranthus tricolor]